MFAFLEQRLSEAMALHIDGRVVDAAVAYFDIVRGLPVAKSDLLGQCGDGLGQGESSQMLHRLEALLAAPCPFLRIADDRLSSRIWGNQRSGSRLGDNSRVKPSRFVDPVQARFPVRFGCLADTDPISCDILRLWTSILDSVPGSTLILAPSCRDARELTRRIEGVGLHEHRVSLIGAQQSASGFEDAQALIDVVLDTFPISRPERVCDALAAGRPVVVLETPSPSSAVSARILEAVDRGRWVATSPEEYAEIAHSLGSDKQLLALESRSLLEQAREGSPLDRAVQALRIQSAVRRRWMRRTIIVDQREVAPGLSLEGTG